jgi:hypothetical protein
MEGVLLRQHYLDWSGGANWLLMHDPDTGPIWLYLDKAADMAGPSVQRDEWTREEAPRLVPADVWRMAVAAREGIEQQNHA